MPWRPNYTTVVHHKLRLSESTDAGSYVTDIIDLIWCEFLIISYTYACVIACFSAERDAIEIINHGMPKPSKDPNCTSAESMHSSGNYGDTDSAQFYLNDLSFNAIMVVSYIKLKT